MMSKYENISLKQIREMILSNQLDDTAMTLSDFECLFWYEMNKKDPDTRVIDYCISHIGEYAEYKTECTAEEFENIRKMHLNYITSSKKATTSRTLYKPKRMFQKVLLVGIACFISIIMMQVVSLAIGHNLFNYIYSWFANDETVTVTSTEEIIGLHEYENDYYEITSVPTNLANFIPDYVYEKYDFIYLRDFVRSYIDKKSFEFNTGNQILWIEIVQANEVFIEKSSSYISEEKDGVTYYYFENVDTICCTWEYNNYVYLVDTKLPNDELRKIVDSFEHKVESPAE